MFSHEHQANICVRWMMPHRDLCLILPFPSGVASYLVPHAWEWESISLYLNCIVKLHVCVILYAHRHIAVCPHCPWNTWIEHLSKHSIGLKDKMSFYAYQQGNLLSYWTRLWKLVPYISTSDLFSKNSVCMFTYDEHVVQFAFYPLRVHKR